MSLKYEHMLGVRYEFVHFRVAGAMAGAMAQCDRVITVYAPVDMLGSRYKSVNFTVFTAITSGHASTPYRPTEGSRE